MFMSQLIQKTKQQELVETNGRTMLGDSEELVTQVILLVHRRGNIVTFFETPVKALN